MAGAMIALRDIYEAQRATASWSSESPSEPVDVDRAGSDCPPPGSAASTTSPCPPSPGGPDRARRPSPPRSGPIRVVRVCLREVPALRRQPILGALGRG